MPPKLVTLVRHAQGEHNVGRRYQIPDPALTSLGISQCAALSKIFPLTPPISLLIASPMRRTVQTALHTFRDHLAALPPVLAQPLLTEVATNPCDIGSPTPELKTFFGEAPVDWGLVDSHPEWTGGFEKWGAKHGSLMERAREAREWLWGLEEDHVVCVLHGAFMHYLTDIWDRPPGVGTGWENTEVRQYRLVRKDDEVTFLRIDKLEGKGVVGLVGTQDKRPDEAEKLKN